MSTRVTTESPIHIKRRKYNRLMAEAEAAYRKAIEDANNIYEQVTGPAREKFEKAIAPHRGEFEKATSDALKARDTAIAEADAQVAAAHETASKEAGFGR